MIIIVADNTKVYSQIQEKRVGKYLNWGVVSGSGCRAGHPGDLMGAHFLGECKTHTDRGHKITFNLNVWVKLCNESQSIYKFPVLIVDDGSQDIKQTWCLFPVFVCPSYTEFKPLSLNIRKNIVFDPNDLHSIYLQDFNSAVDRFGVYTAEFNNETVCICPLSEFNKVFGDH